MRSPHLSVVIPAYNEEARLQATLTEVMAFLNGEPYASEVLLVDDGSVDRTSEIARSFSSGPSRTCEVLVLQSPINRGKGYSVRRGMLASRGDYGLISDADLSVPIMEVRKLSAILAENCRDIVFGSRSLPDSKIEVHQSRIRRASSRVFNFMVRLITGLPYADTQCGFKLFRLQTCRALFENQRIHDFGFDVEILYMASKWGLSVQEVPVIWRHWPGTKVRMWSDAFYMLMDLLKIRWNDCRGRYNRAGTGIG
ncbi:MAG: glycosyltransferase family 2 protein [Acidobacteria bacterium]|nr:glycosyltransferase family 2 protein [Acidobacteriota bacterium]